MLPIPCPIPGLQDAGPVALWLGLVLLGIGIFITALSGAQKEYVVVGAYFAGLGILTLVFGWNFILLVLLAMAGLCIALAIENQFIKEYRDE